MLKEGTAGSDAEGTSFLSGERARIRAGIKVWKFLTSVTLYLIIKTHFDNNCIKFSIIPPKKVAFCIAVVTHLGSGPSQW